MSMKNTKFTGLFTRKKAVRYLIYVLFVCVFAVFVIKLNQVEKTELVVRTGQTFEKAKVVKILQDNLEENGTRVGEQKVRVRMLTGVRKGEELDVTSSSGYLFGAACKPGMKVIVMQSVAGDSTVASVYTQDREGVIYIFALIYLLVLCLIGGKQGIKGKRRWRRWKSHSLWTASDICGPLISLHMREIKKLPMQRTNMCLTV